ncbi:hypothetical protein BJ138DRAFT_1159241 [Hygrophoropsis aurantiaca]|uniref:Uncharacterized protein n=1 Tax=Hygrophoropsis aurantiaca TaxID=72124 RepID=A0ACB8A2X1_9AGAM|nr:hypothetical protein BJ138DRAFT_1159241 [Hygrophoropsis aurantiaca]
MELEGDERSSDDDEYWNQVDEVDMDEGGVAGGRSGTIEGSRYRNAEWRKALMKIKKVIITSIMMQSTNQKCNALEAIMGIFLHSCNTPERAIQALARMGISISIGAIHDAVRSLSRESYGRLRSMGKTLNRIRIRQLRY